ncbi:hypothetical protein [Rheinheimera hassiensis]|uniref:hypothetical protein n=1 Tax=Rheinheimera hassiensis TaxID=1193627 RepID=UPI001F069458|nr:hypothetical protein [Rheinheimera hassiensis]
MTTSDLSQPQEPLSGGPPMGKVRRLFQAISYLQYPLLLVAFGYMVYPYFAGFDTFWTSVNNALIFSGLAISFSTLQDTTKTQNSFSKKIWEDTRKGGLALVVISGTTLLFLALGMFGFFVSKGGILKEVSFGVLMLGIGYVGLLKTAIEMHEHHRVVAGALDSTKSV